jgi:hypothetical protein
MLLSWPQESRPRNMMLHSVRALQKGFSEGTPRRVSCCKAQLTAKPERQPIVSQDPAALRLHADSPARTFRPAALWGWLTPMESRTIHSLPGGETPQRPREISLPASVAGPLGLGLWLCAVATGCRAPDKLRVSWEQSQRRNFTRVTTSPIRNRCPSTRQAGSGRAVVPVSWSFLASWAR